MAAAYALMTRKREDEVGDGSEVEVVADGEFAKIGGGTEGEVGEGEVLRGRVGDDHRHFRFGCSRRSCSTCRSRGDGNGAGE